jgi:hypothetical protein
MISMINARPDLLNKYAGGGALLALVPAYGRDCKEPVWMS